MKVNVFRPRLPGHPSWPQYRQMAICALEGPVRLQAPSNSYQFIFFGFAFDAQELWTLCQGTVWELTAHTLILGLNDDT